MWVHRLFQRLIGAPRADVTGDMSWLSRIPRAAPPPGRSSVFGSHIAINKAQCPFRFLARPDTPDTVRVDHGIMSASTPDAVYTKDPVLTRKVLQSKAHPKTRGWYRFHHRLYNYRIPPDILTYSNADDPMVVTMRRIITAGLADAFEQQQDKIAVHIGRWVADVARGPVEMRKATRRLNAEILHLVAFGELPSDRWFAFAFENMDSWVIDSKRRLAHLLWPRLDRLPTPYALTHLATAEAFRWLTARRFRQFRHSSSSLRSWSVKSRPERIGTPSTPKNPGETTRN